MGFMETMIGFKSVLVAVVLLLAVQVGAVGDESASPSPTSAATRVNCRDAMNAVRSEAGLQGFDAPTKESSKLPIVDSDTEGGASTGDLRGDPSVLPNDKETTAAEAQATFLSTFCSAISAGSEEEQTTDKGTYMVAPATSNDTESCAAAVEFWAEAKSNFTSLPPAYSTSDPLYKDDRNISFVGLFNPRTNPTVDCALITCNAQTANEGHDSNDKSDSLLSPSSAPGDQNSPAEKAAGDEHDAESPEERRLEATNNAANFLICLSIPQALQKNETPFTQEQWDKIKGVENSSPSWKLFAVVALGAAAFLHWAF